MSKYELLSLIQNTYVANTNTYIMKTNTYINIDVYVLIQNCMHAILWVGLLKILEFSRLVKNKP